MYGGTVLGDVALTGNSMIYGGTVQGNATFDYSDLMGGTVVGSALFANGSWWMGGTVGTQDMTAYLLAAEATGHADELASNQASVTTAKETILETTTLLTIAGTLPQAKVLVSGGGSYVEPVQAEVIRPADGGTPYGPNSGTNGTFNKSAAEVAAATAQYIIDQGVVFANQAYILINRIILGIAGTFNEASRNIDPATINVDKGVVYKIRDIVKVGTLKVPVTTVINTIRITSNQSVKLTIKKPTTGTVFIERSSIESGVIDMPSCSTIEAEADRFDLQQLTNLANQHLISYERLEHRAIIS
jgi:hypothetical protein